MFKNIAADWTRFHEGNNTRREKYLRENTKTQAQRVWRGEGGGGGGLNSRLSCCWVFVRAVKFHFTEWSTLHNFNNPLSETCSRITKLGGQNVTQKLTSKVMRKSNFNQWHIENDGTWWFRPSFLDNSNIIEYEFKITILIIILIKVRENDFEKH